MDPLISTIMGWGPNWAPRGWALCAGQLLPISSHTALFSLIGTIYGGDGRTTFALPDLRGRVPIAAGQSPGTSFYPQGAKVGAENRTLTQLEMPVHSHPATFTPSGGSSSFSVSSAAPNQSTATNGSYISAAPVQGGQPVGVYTSNGGADVSLGGLNVSVSGNVTVGNAGGSQPFSVVQPLLAIQFIIALVGIFPSRN